MSWLDPVRVALDAATTPCPVFFRTDDAGWGDAELLALLAGFAHRGVPIDVAVIPAALTPPLVRELRARQATGRVHLHQHGFRHENHEPTGRKHEFGPSRDRAVQHADVRRGREAMDRAFGDQWDPVFTPPWNRCTKETADVLIDLGYAALSRDSTACRFERPELPEVPIAVDWFGHRKGVRWRRGELADRLAGVVVAGGPLGVMLHHAVTDDADGAAIVDLVALVAGHPAAATTSILELVPR